MKSCCDMDSFGGHPWLTSRKRKEHVEAGVGGGEVALLDVPSTLLSCVIPIGPDVCQQPHLIPIRTVPPT